MNATPKTATVQTQTLTDGSTVYNVVCDGEEIAAPATLSEAEAICVRLNAGHMPTWDEIKDKAHLYATARLRSTGEYVQLCRVVKFIDGGELKEPVFACRIPSMAGVEHRTTQELYDFCL